MQPARCSLLPMAERHRRWPSCNDLRNNLWPWLQEREYAAPEDDEWLDAFLERLDQPTPTCVPESR